MGKKTIFSLNDKRLYLKLDLVRQNNLLNIYCKKTKNAFIFTYFFFFFFPDNPRTGNYFSRNCGSVDLLNPMRIDDKRLKETWPFQEIIKNKIIICLNNPSRLEG